MFRRTNSACCTRWRRAGASATSDGRRIVEAECFNRDSYALGGFSMALFERLRRRGLIESHNGRPYRISRLGLVAVRSQLDNR